MSASTVRARLMSRAALVALAAAAVGGAAFAGAGSAAASSSVSSHQPFGRVESMAAPNSAMLELVGWASDPDDVSTDLTIAGVVDGTTVVAEPTSIPRPYMTREHGAGPTPGFVLDVPVPADGHNHTVCVAAHNIDDGLDRVLRCVFTPLGRTPGSAELATHSPYGSISFAEAADGDFHLTGWATDPDYRTRRLQLAMYLDGTWVLDSITGKLASVPTPDNAGPRSAFDLSVPASAGAHLGCVFVLNVGPGSTKALGCRGRDSRGTGTGTVTAPPVNAQIVTEAKKHIGQSYVWGAEGPTVFDCSGLVAYSYSKFGVSTPRTSSEQFHAARKIPADRAVPGDLVFYHDLTGDVYHVGIYLSPGLTVAAIDTAEGVDYQQIWDPDTATYGSFTHS